MTDRTSQQIRTGIASYFTPILLAILGYMFQQQFKEIKTELKELRQDNSQKVETIIELREKLNDIERRIGVIESRTAKALYKHEETFYLEPKTQTA